MTYPDSPKSFRFFLPLCLACGFALLSLSGTDARADTDPGTPATGSVTLAWDRNPEPDVIGYRLYYGTDEGEAKGEADQMLDVGNKTTWKLEGLCVGLTYHATVTVYNSAGLESLPSNRILFVAAPPDPEIVPPKPPRITLTPTGTIPNWSGPGGILIELSGEEGQQAIIEYSDNLMTWTPMGTAVISSTGTRQTFAMVPIAAGGQRFFRLRVNG